MDHKTGCQVIQVIKSRIPLKSHYTKQEKELLVRTLDSLMDFVVNNTIRKIFLARDFNARTRNINHDILEESEDMNKGNSSELSDSLRMSKDTTLNTRGRLFRIFSWNPKPAANTYRLLSLGFR